jgi:hypothetical protein
MRILTCQLCETKVVVDAKKDDIIPPIFCLGTTDEDPRDASAHGLMEEKELN